jgi:hypothetical protein
MARVFAVVTCFNEQGYAAYGHRMVETFDRWWPRSVRLLAYSEGFAPEVDSPRIEVRDLLAASPELVAFRERHRDNPRAHGWTPRRFRVIVQWHKRFLLRVKLRRVRAKDTYRWEAVRFSHKSFAIFHAAATCGADVLFWLDADLLTLDAVPPAFVEAMVPADVIVSRIRRPKFSDCCLVGLNLRHPGMPEFLARFRDLYVNDTMFDYPQYHDSYLFDVVAREAEREGGLVHDLAEGVGRRHDHVFPHCRLGRYFDHLKGARKALELERAARVAAAREREVSVGG